AILSSIIDVKTTSAQLIDGPVTIQLPSVQRRIIDFNSDLRDGETLLVACPPPSDKEDFFYLAFTSRLIQESRSPRDQTDFCRLDFDPSLLRRFVQPQPVPFAVFPDRDEPVRPDRLLRNQRLPARFLDRLQHRLDRRHLEVNQGPLVRRLIAGP